jgi:hypothetical protein
MREVEIRRIMVQGQPGQKLSKTPSSQSISQAWWCRPVVPATQEAVDGKMVNLPGRRDGSTAWNEKFESLKCDQ